MNNNEIGQLGEEIAAERLKSEGFTILERNWRHRHWEIDIIASQGRILHFIEVKTRRTLRFGYPEESISREKMTHLRNAAEAYLYKHPQWKYIQFDVMAVTLLNGEIKEVLRIKDVYF